MNPFKVFDPAAGSCRCKDGAILTDGVCECDDTTYLFDSDAKVCIECDTTLGSIV